MFTTSAYTSARDFRGVDEEASLSDVDVALVVAAASTVDVVVVVVGTLLLLPRRSGLLRGDSGGVVVDVERGDKRSDITDDTEWVRLTRGIIDCVHLFDAECGDVSEAVEPDDDANRCGTEDDFFSLVKRSLICCTRRKSGVSIHPSIKLITAMILQFATYALCSIRNHVTQKVWFDVERSAIL